MTDKTESLVGEHVVAVLASPAMAREEAGRLKQDGFGTTDVFAGEALADSGDATGEKSGIFTKLVRHVQDALSEQQNIMAQYEEEARNGKGVLAVQVEGREQAEAVRDAIARQGGYNIRYFSHLSVTDMSPDTNPSSLGDAPSEV